MLKIIIGGCVAAVIVIGLIIWYVAKKRGVSVKEQVDEVADTISTPAQPEQDLERTLNNLLQININARTKSGFTEEMMKALEVLIDKLYDVLPKINSKWPDVDLTWETTRIATKHLPEFLSRFLVLSPSQLAVKEPQFLESLNIIEIEVDEVIQLFSTNAENEASTRARIIKRKFEQAPSENL